MNKKTQAMFCDMRENLTLGNSEGPAQESE